MEKQIRQRGMGNAGEILGRFGIVLSRAVVAARRLSLGVARGVFGALCVLVAAHAQASFHTFALDEIYSSADGNVQFIVLRETQASDNENLLGGHALTASRAGFAR